ncbi:MAG: hypothetical protein QOG84_2153 [Sphingomonadales bacterium]|jgi:hypothetical protein|nr:hypothetical protein [Sphingomonadales bacterium]
MIFSASANPPLSSLTRAYIAGNLTPFLGAGISRPRCPGWIGFIEQLEAAAGIGDAVGIASSDLIRRASRATRVLRNRSAVALTEAVRTAIYGTTAATPDPGDVPEATKALADIWWPLVITTNYESLFLDAWNNRWVDGERGQGSPLPEFTRMLPVGRGRIDCQRVLNATRTPDNPLLWALQGFLGSPGKGHALASELTIGHEEYRRQTHEAVHFRRTFAEMYRSRTLLFLGSGLQETYLLDLFGEALELLGTVDHFHYAVVPKGKVDSDFLERRLQILAIEYEPDETAGGHGTAVAGLVRRMGDAFKGPHPRTGSWTLNLHSTARITSADRRPDLSVVRGRLRLPRREGCAVAASAGRSAKGLLIGSTGRDLIQACGFPDASAAPLRRFGQSYVYRLDGHPVYIVAARDTGKSGRDARDARVVGPATEELLQAATADGFNRVDVMLLASGRYRTFPQYVTLHEMVRGYCRWAATGSAGQGKTTQLRVFTVDPALIGLLEARRIDLLSMADSSEVRFWVSIEAPPVVHAPTLAVGDGSTTIRDVAAAHAIPSRGWTVCVRPAPTNKFRARPIEELIGEDSPRLPDFGVLNGSTILFSRT